MLPDEVDVLCARIDMIRYTITAPGALSLRIAEADGYLANLKSDIERQTLMNNDNLLTSRRLILDRGA